MLDAAQHFRAAQQWLLETDGVAFTSRYLELARPPMRVHVLEAGAGNPTLLIHGGNSMAACWSPLLARLQSDLHLYAPDRPGCGLTDSMNYHRVPNFREHAVAFIESVLDAIGVERAHLIGNSIGGFWALLFALEHPERVGRLALLGEPAGSSNPPSPRHRVLATPLLNRLLYGTRLRPNRQNTRKLLAPVVAHPERLSEAFLDTVHTAAVLPGAQTAWLSMLERIARPGRRVELTYSLRSRLHQLEAPVLLVWGDRDGVGPQWGQRLVEVLPNARLSVVHEAGHLPWLDDPDRVAELVRDFLRGGDTDWRRSAPAHALIVKEPAVRT
jgi:pimeloyl-ACP methyl ester carboxylesterase